METSKREAPTSGRLMSLDALRGFDMFWIIGGEGIFHALAEIWDVPATQILHRQFTHVTWDGVHFYDLIYPLFFFIIGAVLPFSLASRRKRGQTNLTLYRHIVTRSLLLILLGSIPYGLLHFNQWPHLGGVLAHIGLCYFVATLIVMHTGWRTQTVLVGSFLVLYWIASILIPVPGYGAGVFTEEGILAAFIDRQFISGRLWNEGPTSILSGICIILWGTLAGHWLRSYRSDRHKAAGLALAGLAAAILGFVWSFAFPMIKRIVWSSSYVTFACGWSLLLLALFYWVIDVKGFKKWAFFFVVIGMNAITIYFLQGVINFGAIAEIFFLGISNNAGFLQPIILPVGIILIKLGLLWFLYRRRLFFKV